MTRLVPVWIFVACLTAGCATQYSWRASVPLSGSVPSSCLAEGLEAEKDVVEVVPTGDGRFAFRLELPDTENEDWPSFSLHALRRDGEPVLTLSTAYSKGPFDGSADPLLFRARALAADITERCTGRRPKLGNPRPCGRGESNDLCEPAYY